MITKLTVGVKLMNLQQLLGSIESEDLRNQIAESVETAINDEREKGIQKYQKKDREVLKYKGIAKQLGYDTEVYDSVETFIETKKQEGQEATQSKLTLDALNTKYKQLEEKVLLAEKKEKQAIETSRKEKLRSSFTEAIGDKLIGSKYLINDLVNSDSFEIENDKIYKRVDDETVIEFDKVVEDIIESNQDMLKTTVKGGSNSKSTANINNDKQLDFVDKMKEKINQIP